MALAQEAGIRYPVFLGQRVWDRYVKVPEGIIGQGQLPRLKGRGLKEPGCHPEPERLNS